MIGAIENWQQVTTTGPEWVAVADQQAATLVDRLAALDVDLTDERTLHAYTCGILAVLGASLPLSVSALLSLKVLIPEDVK